MINLSLALVASRMFPNNSEIKTLSDGSIQIHWTEENRENSITFFSAENAAKMRQITKNDNGVVWIGDVRLSSTN